MAYSPGKRSAGSSDAHQCPLSSSEKFKQEKPSTEIPIMDPENKSGVSKVFRTNKSSSGGQENGSSGKRKHSRWDATPQADEQSVDYVVAMTKQRKTRWDNDDSQIKMNLPAFATGSNNSSYDCKIQKVKRRLLGVNQRLQSQDSVDELQEDAQLPSSYKKLLKQKQKLMRKLVLVNATFAKKLYLPLKEYPRNKFINIIIGHRGRTQKKMEKETGAQITLCGRGYYNDGKTRQEDGQPNPSDDEDLHVLIKACSQKSLDAAVAMVERQLLELENRKNGPKLFQQKEHAEPNGTLRIENACKTGKVPSKADGKCEICGDARHYTVACPFSGRFLQTKAHENNVNFPTTAGGGFSPFTSSPFPGSQHLDFRSAVCPVPFDSDKFNRNADYTKLYVANLPQYVDSGRLIQLFSPFGAVSYVEVIKDEATGLCKGYGIVEYFDPTCALAAVNQTNGYRLDGKMLVVRLAYHQRCTPGSMQVGEHVSLVTSPAFPSSFAAAPLPAPTCWSGPPGSILPEAYAPMCTSSSYINRIPSSSHTSIPVPTYGSSYISPMPSSLTSTLNATSEEFAQFPGNPVNFASGHRSLFY